MQRLSSAMHREAGSVLTNVRKAGFAVLTGPLAASEFLALARELGEIVDDTPVRVVPGKRTYLASPAAIPLHTDHPSAELIAWRCEAQDAHDGASWLVDGLAAAASLDAATRDQLARTLLPAMIRLGDEPLPTPILSSNGALFYAPWLEPIERPPASKTALAALRAMLSPQEPVSIRLTPGQVLIVDNHRMLHGRASIAETSARRLRRLWLRNHHGA